MSTIALASLLLALPGAVAAPQSPAAPAPPAPDDVRAGVRAYLDEAYAVGLWSGVALVRLHGEDVFRGAIGPFDASAPSPEPNRLDGVFRIGSITKSFTQIALLRLVDRGEVELDEPIAKAHPELAPALGEAVTLRHLLNFTSGLPSELDEDASGAEGVEYDERGLAGPFLASRRPERATEPGERRRYSNLGYWYAGAVLEAATGTTYEAAVRDLVLAPLGLDDTGFGDAAPGDGRMTNGHEPGDGGDRGALVAVEPYPVRARYASGMMTSTLADLERLCDALAADGFLAAESREELFRAFRVDKQEVTLEGGPVFKSAGFVPGWRTHLRFHPREGHLVVLLNNRTVLPPQAIAQLGVDLVNLLRGERVNGPPIPPSEIALLPAGELPETALADAARELIRAIEAGDEARFAAWHAANMPDVERDEIDRNVGALFPLPERMGGWELAGFRELRAGKLLLCVRGDGRKRAFFTFVAAADEPSRVEDLIIDLSRAR